MSKNIMKCVDTNVCIPADFSSITIGGGLSVLRE